MSRMNVKKKTLISQSMNNSRINDSYSMELDLLINHNNKKKNNQTINLNTSTNQINKQNKKIIHSQLLYSPKYINAAKLKETILNKSKSPSSKINSPNNFKKIRTSSIDYSDNGVLKNNLNYSIVSNKRNKLNLTNKNRKFIINDNNNSIKKYNEKASYMVKSSSQKNLQIKKINDNLSSLILTINKLPYNEHITFNAKFSAYFSALEDYINLINNKEEKNLLDKVKNGFKTIFNAFYKFNQKLILLNSQFKKDLQSHLKKSQKKKNNSLKKSNKLNDSMGVSLQILNLKKTYSVIHSKKNLKDNSNFMNNNKTSIINSKTKTNNNTINNTDDNINLSDLESITFCDKIEMRQVNSYKHIPKLDLSSFNKKNFIYSNFLKKFNKKDL